MTSVTCSGIVSSLTSFALGEEKESTTSPLDADTIEAKFSARTTGLENVITRERGSREKIAPPLWRTDVTVGGRLSIIRVKLADTAVLPALSTKALSLNLTRNL